MSVSQRLLAAVGASVLLGGCGGCGPQKLLASPCQTDDDCPEGMLCENYQCVSRDSKRCDLVIDGNPILQPSPHVVDFGAVDTTSAVQRTITVHNIGNCILTLYEANLAKADAVECDLCGSGFPREVFPGRSVDVGLTFRATSLGPYVNDLAFLSDDKEYPTLHIPIHADYRGSPKLVAAPNPVDFGYVAQGRALLRTVNLTNQGTGVAPIAVKSITLDPPSTQDFEFTTTANVPASLAPIGVDKTALIALDVRYHPRTTATHSATLVIATPGGDLKVPLSGNAETPPKININPVSIDLGDVPLGASNAAPLTIVNEGGAPLKVTYLWGGATPSTDLFATPNVLPAVDPGKYVELQVAVTATKVGNYNGLLILNSNDPAMPSKTVAVTARGVPGAGPTVVKLEMSFDNGSDTAFDNDVRDVDLTLEHPYGYVCNKGTPNPANWGVYGKPSWLAFPPKEEPERIVLADATADGTWRVMVNYKQDCASIPTALLAGLLGISIDVLIDYLSGGVIPINGGDVAKLIEQMCLSHKSSTVDVRVFANGTQIGQKNATLGRKGDATYVLDLVRTNGTFTVR